MRNIHLIPTPNPSRLYKFEDKLIKNDLIGLYEYKEKGYIGQNICITNSEEIKEGEYCLTKTNEVIKFKKSYSQGFLYKKIILTTDVDLIKDGVQSIPDEFLEWFVNNSSCECIEIVEQYRKCCRNTDGKNENCIESINCEGWLLGNEYERPYKTNCDKRFEGYKIIIPKEETFNSNRGLRELQLKDPNNCAYYEEIGCIKDVCDCYTLVSKEKTLEHKLKLLVNEWQERQINYETSANNFIEDHSNNRKFTYKAMATRDCWKELLKLIEDETRNT